MTNLMDPDLTPDLHITRALQKVKIDQSASSHYEQAPNEEATILPKIIPGRFTNNIRLRRWTGRDKQHGRKYESYVVPVDTADLKLSLSPPPYNRRKIHYLKKRGRTKSEEKSAAENKLKVAKKPSRASSPRGKILRKRPTDIVKRRPQSCHDIDGSDSGTPRQLKITLPTTDFDGTRDLNIENSSFYLTRTSHLFPKKQLSLSDIGKYLSNDALLKENRKEKDLPLCNAYHAVSCYYNRTSMKIDSPRLVLVHLPDPGIDLEPIYKPLPKLTLR